VLIVEKTVKFHSSLTPADLFTVEIAIQNEDHQEEGSKLADKSSLASFFFYSSFPFELNIN
jgi:hypothetical protein